MLRLLFGIWLSLSGKPGQLLCIDEGKRIRQRKKGMGSCLMHTVQFGKTKVLEMNSDDVCELLYNLLYFTYYKVSKFTYFTYYTLNYKLENSLFSN